MCKMCQNARHEIPARRVTSDNDLRGLALRLRNNVPQGFDGLGELCGVFARRGERVREEENSEVFTGARLDEFEEVLEVAF